jgi:hypothetical protein
MNEVYIPCPECLESIFVKSKPSSLVWCHFCGISSADSPFCVCEITPIYKPENDSNYCLALLEKLGFIVTHEISKKPGGTKWVVVKVLGHKESQNLVCINHHVHK